MVEAVDSPSLFEWNLWRDFEFCPLENFGFGFYKKESVFFTFLFGYVGKFVEKKSVLISYKDCYKFFWKLERNMWIISPF